jgi:uncharacterized protein (UPF0333 family)
MLRAIRNILTKKKAQSTLEYAVLIGVVVAGLIAMQTYVKRGFQGKLRENADSIGEAFSPGYTTYNVDHRSATNSREVVGNGTTTTDVRSQTNDRTGNEDVADFNKEYWWTPTQK